MAKPVVFMFSGQGSHYYQMGRELFELNPDFRRWVIRIDDVCKDILGTSISERVYDEQKRKTEPFDQTLSTHPAIFMVEYALAQILIERGISPDYVLGASLGEFASAAVAGIMSLEETIEAVGKQAELIERFCPPGKMIAVLHDVDLFHSAPELSGSSELSSINYDSHFVISTCRERVPAIEQFLMENNIVYQILPVSHAFHSSSIEPAGPHYCKYLAKKTFRAPDVAFVSSLLGERIESLKENYFWEIVRKPILFREAITYLREKEKPDFVDLGPSATLANFVKYSTGDLKNSGIFGIITPFGGEGKNLDEVVSKLTKKRDRKIDRKEKSMKTYIFPGQGSQRKGMGKGLFGRFRELTNKADEILGYSIEKLCIEDPEKNLGNTLYTQPALYAVNALMYLAKIEEESEQPDYLAGHSLGEYNALFAAGVFDFQTGLRLVQKRGELMSRASGGGMAAVIGLEESKIKDILRKHNLKKISIANYNSPTQIVLSGLKTSIEEAQAVFEKEGAAMYIPLKVSAAFHTASMEGAAQEFKHFLEEFEFNELKIPVISNTTARPYTNEGIKELLVRQIVHPVQWTESIRYLMAKQEMVFEEIGPGNVLTNLIRGIQKESTPLIVDDEEVEKKKKSPSNRSAKKTGEKPIKKGAKVSGPSKENHDAHRGGGLSLNITARSLGSDEFKKTYDVEYAYVAGGMYRGIASKEIVVSMGKAGMLSFFGSGGLSTGEIEDAIIHIQKELNGSSRFGVNLLYNIMDPKAEDDTVDVFLKRGVRNVEAAAFTTLTPALVRYRVKGLEQGKNGTVTIKNRVLAKVSRPEVAKLFLEPAPQRILAKLAEQGKIGQEEAKSAESVPMADDICAEADSGGHTDQGVSFALIPAIIQLRNEMMKQYRYPNKIRVGAAGGIGTPEAAAAAFILGADFILTGSINQCTVEAGISDSVKDMLEKINVQDTDYAPAGDMFELGAKVQVLRKGVFFPARANKLYELYRMYNSIDEFDEKTKTQIQSKYFRRSFQEVYDEVKEFFRNRDPQQIEKAERNPKHKMALIFRWYFNYSAQLALNGREEYKVDYQVHCGPALGAFNQWVKGTELEDWKNRHVDEIGKKMMEETAQLLKSRLESLQR